MVNKAKTCKVVAATMNKQLTKYLYVVGSLDCETLHILDHAMPKIERYSGTTVRTIFWERDG